jgi:DNA-binding NarL/FixJ family response regulator
MNGARIRVVLADDHPIVLAGLRSLVQATDDLDLVGEAATGLNALKLSADLRPDVAVTDISMPELNGIALARRLAEKCASVRLIALTVHEDRAYVNQALQAGIHGYVLKRSAAESLLHAIRAVMVGGFYLDPAVAGRMFARGPARPGSTRPDGSASDLTERETEVLKLTAVGLTNKAIARQLDVSVKSVETYKARGVEKLGLRGRAAIIRYASAQGWLSDL